MAGFEEASTTRRVPGKSARYKSLFDATSLDFAFSANAIAKSAVVAARQMNAQCIVCVTESGGVARLVSEYRPDSNVVAFTSRPEVYRRLALYWGVEPVMKSPSPNFDELIRDASRLLCERALCKPGELIVLAVAVPFGSGQSANTLHIHRIDDRDVARS